MTKTIKSLRFEKEFSVETVKAGKSAVNPEDMLVVRFSSLKAILKELGDTVKLVTEPIIVPPVVCVKAIIRDDAGAEVTAYGSVNINAENTIPRKFSVETALSRAVSNAVIEYCEFEGRVYSDVAIPAEESEPVDVPKAPEVKEVQTAKKYEPKSIEDDMPDEAPKAVEEAPKKAAPKKSAASKNEAENLGDYVVTFGNDYTKGKKLSELSSQSLEWLAGLKPNATTKEAKEKATAYLASKKK